MKTKDGNCVGILSDQGKAATDSNLSEYTIISVPGQSDPKVTWQTPEPWSRDNYPAELASTFRAFRTGGLLISDKKM